MNKNIICNKNDYMYIPVRNSIKKTIVVGWASTGTIKMMLNTIHNFEARW